MPKISVIIPTFNRINSLLKVLEKIENQDFYKKTWEIFEVIIVNDWSIDWTQEILEKYKENNIKNWNKNFEIKILFQENKKQWTARNYWVSEAKSDFILFLQDDIFPEKNLISEHYNFHKNNSNKKIVAIWKTEWNEILFWINRENEKFYRFLDWSWKKISDKIFFKFFWAPLFNYEKLKEKNNSKKISNKIFEINSENNFSHFYTNNLSIKKEFYSENLWFNEKFNSYWWEDIEFWYRLQKKWMKLFFLKNALAKHNHEYNLEKFLNREKKVAENLEKFLEIQPELKNNFYKNIFIKKLLFKIFSSKIFLFFWKIFWKIFYWYFLGKKEFLKIFK